MTIYTGSGDNGRTSLMNQDRVSKTSARIEAYGTVDEANSLIGTIRSPDRDDDIADTLKMVQNHLHIIQADLSNPERDSNVPAITEEHIDELEHAIDEYDASLEPLDSFILPGGAERGARLHHARSVVRRAERRVVALSNDASINERNVSYLNRLSDLLFTLARVANDRADIEEETPTY